ncbi:G/U mismatch-specific DNA glycosylase [Smaragdicoccus niigatensis]|uniref:G/U mismatch-specific DNA glycosylase n=1 Tax=Smaragdicoccus niigatensis TaxID=359359 RepID=UPI00039B3FC3|nr:G/U mismatch-specific DNA glycosylase [Smaragdicoccus niigatensis]
MMLSRAELEAFRDKEVDDLIGPGVKLLFVGINPGLMTAATKTHFNYPGNRFYPALTRAGIVDMSDFTRGTPMTDVHRQRLLDRGIGITNLVRRATIRASELSAEELRRGGVELARLVDEVKPTVVAVAGVTAYRQAFRRPKAQLGRQAESIGGAEVWVVPNPSGLNAHDTVETLAEAYREAAEAAGITT